MVAPYAAAASVVGCLGWIGWTLFQTSNVQSDSARIQSELGSAKTLQAQEEAKLTTLPYDAANMRNVFDVLDSMNAGEVDLTPVLNGLFGSLDNDAIVLELIFSTQSDARTTAVYTVDVRMKLDDLITTADEAVQVASALEARLKQNFNEGFQVEMTVEPVAAQSEEGFSGGLLDAEASAGAAQQGGRTEEAFYTEFRIARVGQ